MSKITTRSVFYYGTLITSLNRSVDFSEGGPELQATLRVSDYSLTEFAVEVQRALREAGTQAYTVSIDRDTRVMTIAAPLAFELLTNTGSRFGTSAYPLMGYDTTSDHTGFATYAAEDGTGYEYQTQYPVDKYVSEAHSLVREAAANTITPVGYNQMVSFGDGARIDMNIRLITDRTDLTNCMEPFLMSATGVDDFMDFMSYAIDKNKLEFMPDVDTRSSFTKVLLESIQGDRNGFSFDLKNMKTPDFYESGVLTFRKVLY